ncbi:hypothetical protein KL86DPRO_10402 [uncultured delta proteobacterium]|uniref:Uncharacterized protein n=1 Tax=uncultured delta proteobacterium TaxID=34034 RepID=A0A212IZM8_9DELT|nr:hypothetical protein KL86DPRO_10402 [uncultured delta proteobacterium]
MQDKTTCSYDFLDFMREEKYYDAARCAHVMLECFGDVIRHNEMMLTVNIRRENIAAALENCNELISYSRLKGMDGAEYETNREALLLRLTRTRTYMAARFWDEVAEDIASAPRRFAAVPLVLTGEAYCGENTETGNRFLTFYIRSRPDARVACRLAASEPPFMDGLAFPRWTAVHGRFLSASSTLILLDPCHYIGSFDNPPQ